MLCLLHSNGGCDYLCILFLLLTLVAVVSTVEKDNLVSANVCP